MLQAILNKSWRQQPTKQHLYGNLPPIAKTIKIRRTRHVRNCWRSNYEFISDVLLRTPERAKAGRPTQTNIQQLCADTRCSPEDLPEAMDDREGWPERVWDIHTDGVTRRWWWNMCTQREKSLCHKWIIKTIHWFTSINLSYYIHTSSKRFLMLRCLAFIWYSLDMTKL